MEFYLGSMLLFTSSDEEENTDQEDQITKMPVKSKETTINMNMTEENPICDIKMNVTEKQKQIIINFMREHPDFGKGKLRYNRCNKSIMDELWRELTTILNSAGWGPRKQPKEWAKTWRDWRSNLFKKVAAHHDKYANDTEGKSSKHLIISPSEKDLLEFLAPEVYGISRISQRGFTSDASSVPKSPSNNDDVKMNIDDFQTNEHHQQANKTLITNKRKCSNETDIGNKRVKTLNVEDSLQQHSSSNTSQYSNIHKELLQLKREKLNISKEKLKLKKKAHEEHMNLLKTIIEAINTATNVIRSLAPEYLE